jgi:hypothetical protein
MPAAQCLSERSVSTGALVGMDDDTALAVRSGFRGSLFNIGSDDVRIPE